MGANNYFKPGDYNAVCGECGDWWKASELRKRWDGIRACRYCFEQRNPQDFLKGVREQQAPPWTNPQPNPIFVADSTGIEQDGIRLVDGFVINGITIG